MKVVFVTLPSGACMSICLFLSASLVDFCCVWLVEFVFCSFCVSFVVFWFGSVGVLDVSARAAFSNSSFSLRYFCKIALSSGLVEVEVFLFDCVEIVLVNCT